MDKREEKVQPPSVPPAPSIRRETNSTILLHLQKQRNDATNCLWPGTETHGQSELPSLPTFQPSASRAPAAAAAADFAPTPARPVPTLTEEEEAEEEQIQLERSHSSARGQPAGQLGRAVSSLQARRLGSRCSASAAGPPGFLPTIYLSVGPSLLRSASVLLCLRLSAGSRNQRLFSAASGSQDPQQCPHSEQIHSLALGIPGTRLPLAGSSHRERGSERASE